MTVEALGLLYVRWTFALTPEEVSLGLDQVGRQSLGSVSVKEREGSSERRDGDSPEPKGVLARCQGVTLDTESTAGDA